MPRNVSYGVGVVPEELVAVVVGELVAGGELTVGFALGAGVASVAP